MSTNLNHEGETKKNGMFSICFFLYFVLFCFTTKMMVTFEKFFFVFYAQLDWLKNQFFNYCSFFHFSLSLALMKKGLMIVDDDDDDPSNHSIAQKCFFPSSVLKLANYLKIEMENYWNNQQQRLQTRAHIHHWWLGEENLEICKIHNSYHWMNIVYNEHKKKNFFSC